MPAMVGNICICAIFFFKWQKFEFRMGLGDEGGECLTFNGNFV